MLKAKMKLLLKAGDCATIFYTEENLSIDEIHQRDREV